MTRAQSPAPANVVPSTRPLRAASGTTISPVVNVPVPTLPSIAYNKIKSSNPTRIYPPAFFGHHPAAWSPIVRSQPDNYLDYPGNVALLREPQGIFGFASRNSSRSSELLATG